MKVVRMLSNFLVIFTLFVSCNNIDKLQEKTNLIDVRGKKAEILPKWLALWGIITVPLILVFVPLGTFGIEVPFALLVPYVPFEFFAGIYILIKYRNKKVEEQGRDKYESDTKLMLNTHTFSNNYDNHVMKR